MAAGTIVSFSAVSIVQAIAGPRGEAWPAPGLRGTLAGAGLGALAALALTRPRHGAATAPAQGVEATGGTGPRGWADWRPFRVARKVKESEEITSFHLEPLDAQPLPDFMPGQFLTLRLEIPGAGAPVIRTYSLSDYPRPTAGSHHAYRLSIKREPAPTGQQVPPGVASNVLHDHIQEGSILEVRPPSGSFVLDPSPTAPVVLLSNGVGITPMMAMLKAVAVHNPARKIWFFHGARDGRVHAFRQEVAMTAQGMEGLTIHYAYSRPQPEDQGQFHSQGYVDVPLIRSFVQEAADYFLCGSPAFMTSIRAGLKAEGVPEERVRFEMFSKPPRAAATTPPGEADAALPGSLAATVTFARSGRTVEWQGDHDNLLAFAEAHGLRPDHSCRAGICGTCECRLLEGEVIDSEPPTATVAPGSVLICISRPGSAKVSLDL